LGKSHVLLLDLLPLPEEIVVQSIVLRSFVLGTRIPLAVLGLVLSLVLGLRHLVFRGAWFGIRTIVLGWFRPLVLLLQTGWLLFRIIGWVGRRLLLPR
jgi:hypothetical protein